MKIKPIHVVIGGVAGYFLFKNMLGLKRFSEKIIISNSVKINKQKTDISKIVLDIVVTIKNPTNQKVRIKYPFVQMYMNESLIGTSEPKSEYFNIEANNTTQFPVSITISTMDFATAIGSKDVINTIKILFKTLSGTATQEEREKISGIAVNVETLTEVFGVPYTHKDKIPLISNNSKKQENK
ncbi:MAG: hypothetical protein QXS90_00350 [Candidatus Diapherotrites archaeon]